MASSLALAIPLEISYFEEGNPLEGASVTTEVLDGYYISSDKSKILRNDLQFEITTAFGVGEEEGKTVFIPYAGKEKATYDEDLFFGSTDLRFGASNLTYWLGKTVDQILELGFLQTKKLDIKVYSHCKDMLNAYFHPGENYICVGHLHKSLGRESLDGMAGLAWDADVIVHELGHGVYNNLITMTTNNYISFQNDMINAMNEGQADFMAHVVTGTEVLAPWMMNITKEYYKKFYPRYFQYVKDKKGLREISNDYKLNTHFYGEIHDDGSVLAGALHKVAKKVGKKESFKLWLETITRIHEANNFYDFGKIMEQVDQEQNFGQNKAAIVESFEEHSIYGNPDMLEGDLEIETKIIDDKENITIILKALGIEDEDTLKKLTETNNGNGKLDAGECVSLELAFKNVSDRDLVGLEVFVPNHVVPKGIANSGQNRNYIGFLKPGDVFPQSINPANKRRPWFYVCAGEEFNDDLKLPLFVRNSGENTIKLEAPVK